MFTRAIFRARDRDAYRAALMRAAFGRDARALRRLTAFFGAVFVLAGALPAGATPTTTTGPPPTTTTTQAPPTTTTTAPPNTPTTPAPPAPAPPPTTAPPGPPPRAFSMGYDAGPRLLAELHQSETDIVALEPVLAKQTKDRARQKLAWDRLLARLVVSQGQVRDAQRRLNEVHDQVKALAAQAYTQGSTLRVTAAVSAVVGADSVVSASRDLLLIDRYGHHQSDVAVQYEREKAALDDRVRAMNAERVQLKGRYDAAIAVLAETERQYSDAQSRYADATIGIARFKELATTSASPVLGPSFVTADDLAAFLLARGYHPHISVPLRELAQYYIDEGNDIGVRGDVAWAQSILETDGLQFPGSGALVGVTDNNYAGIGACDSCKHAFSFQTARLGVRAQVQLLRTYVDAKFGPDNSVHPILLRGTLRLGFRGNVHSWWDLGHHWATGANYGDRVYAIYMQIVAFARARH
ncbi:MAG: Mannosyl-glycoprotein endo-beta-N-acetylglucosaminidase [Actinomycetia bacterium]|nr:Mannosyl-glycoprotein endo-beta-N-acetylglucosaminidase [Actinomycetes bacterium]